MLNNTLTITPPVRAADLGAELIETLVEGVPDVDGYSTVASIGSPTDDGGWYAAALIFDEARRVWIVVTRDPEDNSVLEHTDLDAAVEDVATFLDVWDGAWADEARREWAEMARDELAKADTLRAKGLLDGAETLDEAVERLLDEAIRLRALAKAGWTLQEPIADDYGMLLHPPVPEPVAGEPRVTPEHKRRAIELLDRLGLARTLQQEHLVAVEIARIYVEGVDLGTADTHRRLTEAARSITSAH